MNEPQPMPQTKPAMIRPWLLIVFIIVLLAAGGYIGWWYYTQSKITTPATTPTTTTPTTSTADWKTYTNDTLKLSFKYPSSYTVIEDSKTTTTYVTPDKNPACPVGEFCSGPKYYNQISIRFEPLADNEKSKNIEDIIKQQNSDKKGYEYQLSISKIGSNSVAKVIYPCSATVNGETIDLGGVGCDKSFYQLTDNNNVFSIYSEGTVIDINTFLSTFQFSP